MTTAKPHILTLNNGAVHQLAQILGAPGLLTDPMDIARAAMIQEESLLELPKVPDIAKGTDQLDVTKQVNDWQRDGTHAIGLSERQRETVKKAVKASCEKGQLPPGPGSLCLLNQLHLADEA